MANNSIQVNATEIGCDINWDIFFSYWLYSSVVCSVASFAGNVLVILIVYKTKTLRTTTNYFIVNMAISDVFVPALDTLRITLLYRKDAPALTQTFFTILCRMLNFLTNLSYVMSMTSLVVITAHRFYAVVFPLRARLERRRARIVLLLSTWLIPIAVLFSISSVLFIQYGKQQLLF